jgi:hypothetical protein
LMLAIRTVYKCIHGGLCDIYFFASHRLPCWNTDTHTNSFQLPKRVTERKNMVIFFLCVRLSFGFSAVHFLNLKSSSLIRTAPDTYHLTSSPLCIVWWSEDGLSKRMLPVWL